jgi:hypothetical protein
LAEAPEGRGGASVCALRGPNSPVAAAPYASAPQPPNQIVALPPLGDALRGPPNVVYVAPGPPAGGAVAVRLAWFETDASGRRTSHANTAGFNPRLRGRQAKAAGAHGLLLTRERAAVCAALPTAPLAGGAARSGASAAELQWDPAAAAYHIDVALAKAGCYRVRALRGLPVAE